MICNACFYGVVFVKSTQTPHFREVKCFCTLIGDYVEEVVECSAYITPDEVEEDDDEE